MRLRVVWGTGETMARAWPSAALSNVDFPTFGRPTMAALPLRCSDSVPCIDGRFLGVTRRGLRPAWRMAAVLLYSFRHRKSICHRRRAPPRKMQRVISHGRDLAQ